MVQRVDCERKPPEAKYATLHTTLPQVRQIFFEPISKK